MRPTLRGGAGGGASPHEKNQTFFWLSKQSRAIENFILRTSFFDNFLTHNPPLPRGRCFEDIETALAGGGWWAAVRRATVPMLVHRVGLGPFEPFWAMGYIWAH